MHRGWAWSWVGSTWCSVASVRALDAGLQSSGFDSVPGAHSAPSTRFVNSRSSVEIAPIRADSRLGSGPGQMQREGHRRTCADVRGSESRWPFAGCAAMLRMNATSASS